MNRRPSGLTMSKAIPGFIQYKEAEGISNSSIIGYKHDLKLWLEHMGDQPVDKITARESRRTRNEGSLGYFSFCKITIWISNVYG